MVERVSFDWVMILCFEVSAMHLLAVPSVAKAGASLASVGKTERIRPNNGTKS